MRPLAVVVASGGLDSTVLATSYARTHDLLLVGFDYGQRHHKELDALADVAAALRASHHLVDLTGLRHLLSGSSLTDDVAVPDGHYSEESMRITVVPNRNAIMLSIAVGIAVAKSADVVATGIHAGDHFIYPDCRPAFFGPFAEAMRAAVDGFSKLDVVAPFLGKTKADVVALGSELGAPLWLSWSCYKGGALHCGTCGTCVERREAFELAGVPDPTVYDREKVGA